MFYQQAAEKLSSKVRNKTDNITSLKKKKAEA
jgi:hypothetical protein